MGRQHTPENPSFSTTAWHRTATHDTNTTSFLERTNTVWPVSGLKTGRMSRKYLYPIVLSNSCKSFIAASSGVVIGHLT